MSNSIKNNSNKYSYREPEFFNYWRKLFLYIITKIFYMMRFKLVYRLEVIGRENIPQDNNYIVAANHLSTLDPPLMCSIMDRGVAYMAKKELFENPFMRWWLDWLGAFAVDREKLGVSTIKTVKNIKNTDWVMGIFPQGRRQEPGVISQITKGFASLAKSTNCNILPVGINGTQQAKWLPFSGKIVVRIGKIIPCCDDVNLMVNNWVESIQDLTGYKYEEIETPKIEE